MTEQEILTQLTKVLQDVFDDPSIILTMETTAVDIEEWDSFNHINIIVAAEAHFHVKFKTAETEELKNVGDFVRLIQRKLADGTKT